MFTGEKNIADMLVVVQGDITDKKLMACRNIDTVVNAAKPSLMGSNQGVDGAIHKAVNQLSGVWNDPFRDKICEELKTDKDVNRIRCQRGKAVLTTGNGWCRYIIHVVGIPFDGNEKWELCSSSSRVRILESCYEEIVEQLKKHSEIKAVAVPIIGAGEYGFPIKLAIRIAIATIGNALVEWRKKDPELFDMKGIEKIYFYVFDKDEDKGRRIYFYADGILKKYVRLFENNKRVVFQYSPVAHIQYLNEIVRYDEMRGYFSVAKMFRILLQILRIPFLLIMLPKDIIGRNNWQKRRASVEILALVKMLLPLLFFCLIGHKVSVALLRGLCIFFLCDTITYLLTLILLADIQKPSANIIRSMIMLLVNYVEVSFELAFLYYTAYAEQVSIQEAIIFGGLGILGAEADQAVKSIKYSIFLYLDAGTKFFFASLVFGYFANHMRQRRFRS